MKYAFIWRDNLSHKKKHEDLDRALDKIRKKYGDEAVVRGGQYGNKERNEKNHPVFKGH